MKDGGNWFSFVITKKTLFLILVIACMLIGVLIVPTIFGQFQRRLYGIKQGVTLEGHNVGGLLEGEAYDAVASIAEGYYKEARNASWDWYSNRINVERVGKVVDIKETVNNLFSAEPGKDVELLVVEVVPSITSANFRPYYRGPTVEPKISLMVNVDWGNKHIPSMLETFERSGVTTTWFPTGKWVEKSPEMAKQIALAGHEVGNHGGWHGMASEMSNEEVQRLILDGEELIVNITGQKPTLFAPPAGDMNEQTVAAAAELGYKTILWTIDTIDWQRPAPTVIIDRVVGKAQNGALVLLHPTKPTAEALPLIIEQLHDKGYSLVIVSELLGE